MLRKVVSVLLLLGAVFLLPRNSHACAVCACGDPTLTVMGMEKPFVGRLRLSAQYQHRSETTGRPNLDAATINEERWDLAGSYVVTPRLILSLQVPVLALRAQYANLGQSKTAGLGDITARGRYVVWQDRPFMTGHLLALQGSITAPTAIAQRDSHNRLLDIDLQLGKGAWSPQLGLVYSGFWGAWSAYSSASLLWPLGHRWPETFSRTWLASALVQYQPIPWLALQAGLDGRSQGALTQNAKVLADTGGHILFSSFGWVLSPISDWLLTMTVRVPTVNRLFGRQQEGIVYNVGLIYDM